MIQIIIFLLTLFCFSLRRGPSNICNSKSCTSVAKQISELMDQESDPCIDFNKFACGGFEKTSILNGPNDMKTTVDFAIKTLRQRVHKLLERKVKQKNDFETDEKVRDFYAACLVYHKGLNMTRLEHDWTSYMSENFSPYIHELMKKIGLGGWPYSANSLGNSSFRWFDVIPKLIQAGHMYTDGVLELPIINVEVGVDDFTRERYTLNLDAPDFDVDHDNTGINLCTNEMHTTGCYVKNDKSILAKLKTIISTLNPNQEAFVNAFLNC